MPILLLLLQLVSQAQAAEEPAERLAKLETQVTFLSAAINRVELKLDEIANKKPAPVDHDPLREQWPTGLLTALIILDKAGYYIKRRNGDKK